MLEDAVERGNGINYTIWEKVIRNDEKPGMKSDKTYQLEETIALATWKLGQIGCPEVGLGEEGIIDYITMEMTGDRLVRCYELKITKEDFLSDAKKTFIGDYNYYVIPTSLWNAVRSHIAPGIGCWCMDNRGQAQCMLEAERRECSLDRNYVARRIIHGLRREHSKIDRERWESTFKRKIRLTPATMRDCFASVIEHATSRNNRYGCSNVRMSGQAMVTPFVTIDISGKGYVRCYDFKAGDEISSGEPQGLVGDFNFYVVPLSDWGRASREVPRWIGIWCIDERGRAIRKRAAKHVSPKSKRGVSMVAIAMGLDRERMLAVEEIWSRRQRAQKILDRDNAEVGAGDTVSFGGSRWLVRSVDYERDGTILSPVLTIDSERVAGVSQRVSPRQVKRM